MIAVRIPKEIREYKEKMVWGLTLRQLIAVALALGICAPLYFFGTKYIHEEIVSWAVMIIGIPLLAFGFVRINGMPMEKFAMTILKQKIFYPKKRLYKAENIYTVSEKEFEKEHKTGYRKNNKKAGLERTILLQESIKNGEEVDLSNLDEKLLTVSNFSSGNNRKDDKKKKDKKKKVSRLERQGIEIQKRIDEDPYYIPTKKERKIMLRYRKFKNAAVLKERKKSMKTTKKSIAILEKRRKVKTAIPDSTQKTIPYMHDYKDGMFEVEPGRYSKVFHITDINYNLVKEEEQVNIFCRYGECLNYFSEDIGISITIDNRIISKAEQEDNVLYPLVGDQYDVHREEYNNVMRRQIAVGNNDLKRDKYFVVSIEAENPLEALLKFQKMEGEIINNFNRIGSTLRVLSTEERLALMHDKFRKGREGQLNIDYDFLAAQGLSTKDYIAPSSIVFETNHFKIEDEYYRCLYLNNLPAGLSDDFLADLVDTDYPLVTTLNIKPVAQDKALRIVKRQLTGMEANKIEAEKRAIRSGYSPETIGHDLRQSYEQARILLDDMTNKNQKMFFVTFTFMVHGSSLEELETHTKQLISVARKYTCQMQVFNHQQEDAFRVTMPSGIEPKNLFVERTLTTESTAIFIPFSSQQLQHPGGFYYGLNRETGALILVDRTRMKTPSGFLLGSSGSGKSFSTKREIINVLLRDGHTNILIIDPENEYIDFARAFNGIIIDVSASSDVHLNPFDLQMGYSEGKNPLSFKSEYIMSIVECMLSMGKESEGAITPQQKSVLDKCLERTYQPLLEHDYDATYTPTFRELQDELDKEKENSEAARTLAEGIEYYTKGSMDLFSHKSNVDYDNRFVVFTTRDLGSQLKKIGMLITLDFVWNRMIANKNMGIRTYCYVDEVHTLFEHYFSARYLNQLYKRGRKYGLVITSITQNVEDLLRHEQARTMLGNADFILMLNQSSEDLALLAKMLNISEAQKEYVSMAKQGEGLIFAENVIVPFTDEFPQSSYLYGLITTKFGENQESA